MNKFVISIEGPDHDLIRDRFINLSDYTPSCWKYQPLGLAAVFTCPQDILHKLLMAAYQTMREISPRNHLSIVHSYNCMDTYSAINNEIVFCGRNIISLHIPHARVNEDYPDHEMTCGLLMDRLDKGPFQDDHALIRFLNKRHESA